MAPIPHRRFATAARNVTLSAALTLVAACDRQLPTAVPDEPPAAELPRPPRHDQLERFARRVAVALADPAFRQSVRSQLDASPVVEHKLHFQRFLRGSNRRALYHIARANREDADTLDAEARDATTLEMYFPVETHRAAWRGDTNVLVATAITDSDMPVAYDVRGRRHVLSADHPPVVPVLAIVPAETDFDGPARAVSCRRILFICVPLQPSPPVAPTPGLYLTKSLLRDSFESWLKGAPEIEILVLGQKGTTDSLTRYQCIGQRATGGYYFDQNRTTWAGEVLLFSQAQLNLYRAQHAGQAIRLFVMEDDDTSCELRTTAASIQALLSAVDAAVQGYGGGRDTTLSTQRMYTGAMSLQKLFSVVASVIKTNDDMIGNAVASEMSGESYPGYNWVLKGDRGQTNGYFNLVLR